MNRSQALAPSLAEEALQRWIEEHDPAVVAAARGAKDAKRWQRNKTTETPEERAARRTQKMDIARRRKEIRSPAEQRRINAIRARQQREKVNKEDPEMRAKRQKRIRDYEIFLSQA